MSATAPAPARIINGVDCSPEAQATRLARIAEIEGMLFGGASAVSDRNRSVTFRSPADLNAALLALRGERDMCLGIPRGRGRLFYVPQVKAL